VDRSSWVAREVENDAPATSSSTEKTQQPKYLNLWIHSLAETGIHQKIPVLEKINIFLNFGNRRCYILFIKCMSILLFCEYDFSTEKHLTIENNYLSISLHVENTN
jgi:hypothetical protein